MGVERANKLEERQLKLSDFSEEEQNLYWLFYFSYKFSQGQPYNLHGYIFCWLKSNGFLDKLPEAQPKILELVTPPRRHKYQALSDVSTDLKVSYHALRFKPAPIGEKAQELLLYEILGGMLLRDILYQNSKRPGCVRRMKVVTDSNYDPHASFVRKYALNGVNTGHSAFDSLFVQLRSSVIAHLDDPGYEVTAKLLELKDLWEQSHPGESFFTPDFDGHTRENSPD